MADAVADARPDEQPDSPNARVLAALESLSARDRELLTLAVWDRLTTDEIAAVTGLKPAAVRVATHRARQRLREALTAAGMGTDFSRADC